MQKPPFVSSLEGLLETMESLRKLEPVVGAAVGVLRDALAGGNKLLVCGNGGSAADAAHFASELVGRFREDRPSYPAICLPADAATMTGIGNDYGYDEVFARQVRGFGKPGDCLVVFSTSGNSPNIVRALEVAGLKGLTSVAFLGRDGGRAAGLATVDLVVPGTLTARIQEAQKFLLHAVCEQLEDVLKSCHAEQD